MTAVQQKINDPPLQHGFRQDSREGDKQQEQDTRKNGVKADLAISSTALFEQELSATASTQARQVPLKNKTQTTNKPRKQKNEPNNELNTGLMVHEVVW